MYIWFTQRRSLGEPISGPLICEKVLQFNEQLNEPKYFKASSGWFKNFKNRHGIRELDVQGEKLSSDLAVGIVYKEKHKKMVTLGMTYTILMRLGQTFRKRKIKLVKFC